MNHATNVEIEQIKALLDYLNAHLADRSAHGVDVKAALTDSNGESLGWLIFNDNEYVWEFPT